MTETKRWQRKASRTFPKISPAAFQHPMDLKALEAVKSISGVDFLIRKVIEFAFERYYYITNIADSIRVTSRQCPMLNDMLLDACDILDVEVPEFYIDQNPVANAYTFGSEKPFVVIQSGLVDLMTEDELFTVICHEVGHIKCGHVLYKMVARFLSIIVEYIADKTFGLGSLITGPIMVAFYEWDRKAELSADRAGLLGIQNPNVVISTLMKLAGGCSKVAEQMDREEFLRQAENYQELDHSTLNQFYKFLQVVNRTHPFPVLRAKEINEWAKSTEYFNILNGIYPRLDMQPYYSGATGYNFGGNQPPSPGYGGYTPSDYPPGNRPPSGRGVPPSGFSPNQPPQGNYQGGYQGGSNISPKQSSATTCPNCNATVETKATFCHICGSTIVGSIAVMEKNATGQTAYPPPSAVNPTQQTNQPQPPPKPDNKPRCRNCGTNIKPSDDYCPSCGLNIRFDW
jgi:Zn-dependent protease with chaperone function/RNA polymerase subunit RPABC4/transcription elongation factor Spt4